VDAGGRVEVISTKWTTPIPGGQVYSRTLLQAASEGTVAELSSGSGPISESIIQNRIASAICAPILIGPTVAAYLYLDARDMTGAPAPVSLRRNAAAFCLALARMAGLALANLKRIDIERRSAMMEAELSAGAEAQRWILPRREGTFGPFSYIGESRPGTYVAGDFFDVIPLSDTKIAVALGDVSGKGVAASVLMTATQGYLHAALKQDADPARAVTELNRFVCPRRPESRFVTLWVGVFDAESRQVHYVDAGHGYALLAGPDGSCVQLAGGDGLPVGVMEDFIYKAHSATCAAGSRVLIVSDGLVEQMDPGPTNDPARRQFSLEGLQGCLAATAATDDAVAEVFRAVIAHAKTPNLADDATAVLVRL
jgi:sigma-B regulation protein RsbU (phosphoserine phosphatase)